MEHLLLALAFETGNSPKVFLKIYSALLQIRSLRDYVSEVTNGINCTRRLQAGGGVVGTHSVMWGGTDEVGRAVASGVYLCRMEAGDWRTVRRMVLVR